MNIAFAPIFFILLIFGFFILVAVISAIASQSKRDRSEGGREEMENAQMLYQALDQMEQRVENIETILIDKVRERESHRSNPDGPDANRREY